MRTMLLDITLWDLLLDAAGNIAVASDPYSVAQDVASALRLFQGELDYDVTKGIPYFTDVLGELPPVTYFQELMVQAALTVPTVISAQCVINSFEGRTVKGQVTFKTSSGETGTVVI